MHRADDVPRRTRVAPAVAAPHHGGRTAEAEHVRPRDEEAR
ncbi:hypothetical protein H4696_002662 [Amycolatopsis lexingtonensis]|uniref:Uncharacterized protein n=1 Tax=Amycolatopsis lexingtonensis TaxID=218822 RepID=A0ABR9HXU7_9PSEU|nr:hypothetical protein [Amycolatopsis lexingtonensis]MBE1495562.1 hypothetical protein [Amycolatopsis lexingtonensis]